MQKKNYKTNAALTFLLCHGYKKIQKKTNLLSKHKNHTNIYSFYLRAK